MLPYVAIESMSRGRVQVSRGEALQLNLAGPSRCARTSSIYTPANPPP